MLKNMLFKAVVTGDKQEFTEIDPVSGSVEIREYKNKQLVNTRQYTITELTSF